MELTPLDLLAANVPCRGRYDSDVEQWIVMESKCALSSRRMHGTGVSARSGLGYDPGEVQKPISSRSSGRLSMYRARNQGTGNRQSASSCSGGLSGGKDGPMKPRTRLAWLSSAAAQLWALLDMTWATCSLIPNCSLLIAENLVRSLKVDEGPLGSPLTAGAAKSFLYGRPKRGMEA
jgi:hypothetical protein